MQVEKLTGFWADLEAEAPLVPLGMMSGGTGGSGIALPDRQGPAKTGSAAGKGAAKNRRGKQNENHLVLASQLRARSTKDFLEAERRLGKALSDAENVLEQRAPQVLTGPVDSDPSLELLRSRYQLVKIALDKMPGISEASMSRASSELYGLAVQDPYLKDLRTTILADKESCRTVAALKHCRTVTLDLYLRFCM